MPEDYETEQELEELKGQIEFQYKVIENYQTLLAELRAYWIGKPSEYKQGFYEKLDFFDPERE